MRTSRLLGLAVAGALALTACGGPDTVTQSETAAPDAANAGATGEPADADATFTFEHAAGTTEVPVGAERIVTLQDQNGLLPLLELGVTPVGSAALDNGDGTHTFRRVDSYDVSEVEFVGAYGEPDLELIAAQQPDLIIGTEFDEPIHAELSAIAPTVLVQVFGGRELTEVLGDFAELVGETERHEQLLAEYEAAVEQLRADLPRPAEEITVSYVGFYDDGTPFVDVGQAIGTVLGDVGFARTEVERQAEEAGERYEASFETITDFGDSDVWLSGDFSGDVEGDGAPGIAFARGSELFQGLDVVQRGEHHVFDGTQMVGSAFEKMRNFVDFLRETLVEREPNLRDA